MNEKELKETFQALGIILTVTLVPAVITVMGYLSGLELVEQIGVIAAGVVIAMCVFGIATERDTKPPPRAPVVLAWVISVALFALSEHQFLATCYAAAWAIYWIVSTKPTSLRRKEQEAHQENTDG